MKIFKQPLHIWLMVILKLFCLNINVFAQEEDLAKISSIILLQPNHILEHRTNALDLANYLQSIVGKYNAYLLSQNITEEASAIITFAISPNRQSRIWIVDNFANSDNIELLNLFTRIHIPRV